jgi:hypothetical protein
LSQRFALLTDSRFDGYLVNVGESGTQTLAESHFPSAFDWEQRGHIAKCLAFYLLRFVVCSSAIEEKGGPMEQSNGPNRTEDQFTKTIEDYTAAIPSSTYLAVAVGAMGLSLMCQVAGQGKWGNFIAQWVPTWLIIGVYNKLVKLEGHDQYDRGR